MIPTARLTILFDCCHSGSAVELPYVYMPNSRGEVNLIDNVKTGINLAQQAVNLVRGGFNTKKIEDAKALLGGAKSFFAGLQHRPTTPVNEHGLGEEYFVEDWKNERKDAWMFSGCADDQTSADTSIAGAATGAMSYAFIKTMRENPNQSYIEVWGSKVMYPLFTNEDNRRYFKAHEWSLPRSSGKFLSCRWVENTISGNQFL
jgi:hypothetical protein